MWTVNILFVSYCPALIKKNVDIWAALCPIKEFSPCTCSWPKSPTGVMSHQVCRKSLCSAEVFLTMRPLCSSGCQSVCSRVLLTSNLHLNFRLMTFLSHFSRPLSFEDIMFEPHQRLNDSSYMTHIAPKVVLKHHLLPQLRPRTVKNASWLRQ